MVQDQNKMSTINWVYGFDDYVQIYDLTKEDLSKNILEFPGVVGSFNAKATISGGRVTSAGRIYQLSEDEMASYADDVLQKNIADLRAHHERLQIDTEQSLGQVIEAWTKTKETFLDDYRTGKPAGRYLPVDLPDLPFTSQQFDLVLCSHLLFQRPLPAGVSGVGLLETLCGIAEEVRLYPLLDNQGKITDDLGPLMLDLQQKNYGVEVREVAYTLQKGGNAMLRIWAQACVV